MTAIQFNNFRPTTAYIHLFNLEENLRVLLSGMGEKSFFCPMIKANGYGHGDVEIANKLEQLGIKTMGVGLIEEGMLLRGMGVRAELLVFGAFDKKGFAEMLKLRLTPVVSDWQQLEIIAAHASSSRKAVHLKFDTGMHRLGFSWKEAQKVQDFVKTHIQKISVAGICTHLFMAEDSDDPTGKSYEQLRRFQDVEMIFSEFRPISHTLNSAGLLNFIKMKKKGLAGLPGISLNQGARPGISLYGYSPLKEEVVGVDLKPVMSLRSKFIRFHKLEMGEGVSYGHSWRANRESIVGIVPIGYADGYRRLLSNRSHCLFLGKKAPIIGNVCMDYLTVDLTDILGGRNLENLHEEEVTLFGYDRKNNLLSTVDLAEKSQSISWEILTGIGERVPRVFDETASSKTNQIMNEVKT